MRNLNDVCIKWVDRFAGVILQSIVTTIFYFEFFTTISLNAQLIGTDVRLLSQFPSPSARRYLWMAPYNTSSYKHLVVAPRLPGLLSPLAPLRPPALASAVAAAALRRHARGADEVRHDLLRQLGLALLALFLDELDLRKRNPFSQKVS